MDCVMEFPRDNPERDIVTRDYPLGKLQSIYTTYGIVTGVIWGYTSDGNHLVINAWGDFWYAQIDKIDMCMLQSHSFYDE